MTACEQAVWPSGTFWTAYSGNLDNAVEGVIEANPVADAMRTFMSGRPEWTGTSKALLAALGGVVSEQTSKAKGWPNSGKAMSGKLRRVASNLRKIGIEVQFPGPNARPRNIQIVVIQPEYGGESSSQPSQPP
jgi:hypothetical protein